MDQRAELEEDGEYGVEVFADLVLGRRWEALKMALQHSSSALGVLLGRADGGGQVVKQQPEIVVGNHSRAQSIRGLVPNELRRNLHLESSNLPQSPGIC